MDNIFTKILGYAFILACLYDLIKLHNLSGIDMLFIIFGGLAMIVFKDKGLREITKVILNKIK